MFGKRYRNVVRIENPKDAILVVGMEGQGNVEFYPNDELPTMRVLKKQRMYLSALLRSARYSKMGILNCILKT